MFEGIKRSLGALIERFSKTEIDAKQIEPILWDLKLTLIANDVGLSAADQICEDVKRQLEGTSVSRFEDRRKIVKEALRQALYKILKPDAQIDLLKEAAKKREAREPLVVVFVGVNGTGKTTTIAKVANMMLTAGYSVVLACADTYRAGSIEQLEGHAKRLGVRLISQKYGADAAAVVFDAVNYARTHGVNAVLVDTAGRMQTNRNLMDELQKIVRVSKPDLVVFVGDALTGNDAVAQAQEFSRFIPIDASILTKVDADVKGGSAISISYITKRPTIYLGVGQEYGDLIPFDPKLIIDKIL
jgi:fused signal recognition particle receptor